jgi:RNA polymerase sigma-70 factor (ECF subfamily)
VSETTSASLLDRLRQQPDPQGWQRLVDLYTPLIRGWLRQHALPEHDADDLVQEVLAVVVRRLPEFRREPRTGAFRRWLRTITANCLRDFWRARRLRPVAGGEGAFAALLDALEDPGSDLGRRWDEEHDRHVTQRLLEMIRPHFEPKTWEAFRRVALESEAPDAVAAALGLTANAVFIAKSRVLARLREEGAGLID